MNWPCDQSIINILITPVILHMNRLIHSEKNTLGNMTAMRRNILHTVNMNDDQSRQGERNLQPFERWHFGESLMKG